jgi:hypothetical protein
MSKRKDDNDLLREGTLPADPAEDAAPPVEAAPERAGTLATTSKGERERRRAPAIGDVFRAASRTMWRRAYGIERPIPTPWSGVDRIVGGGWWPGLYSLTSNSGVGKTQYAIQSAIHAARYLQSEPSRLREQARQHREFGNGSAADQYDAEAERREARMRDGWERACYVALELGDVDIAARVAGEIGGARWSELFYGRDSAGLARISTDHADELAALPLDIEIGGTLGWNYTKLAELAEDMRPRFMVIDYTQLITAPEGTREDLRQTINRVARMSRHIAQGDRTADAANNYGCAVLAICSTARDNYSKLDGSEEDTSGKKPKQFGTGDAARYIGLGKESGEIEFTGDCVMVMGKDPSAAPDPAEPYSYGVALGVAKGRGFPRSMTDEGWARLWWTGSSFTEKEIQRRTSPPPPRPAPSRNGQSNGRSIDYANTLPRRGSGEHE